MEKLSEEDFYKILAVSRDANETEINKAYKKLAIKYHPDKNPNQKELAEENFKKVSEAYEVLSNPEKRKTYDQFGKQGLEQGGMGGAGNFSSAQAEQIFSQFFGGQDPFSVLFGEMGGRGGGGGGMGGMPPGVQFHFSSAGMPGGRSGGRQSGGRMPGGMGGSLPGGMGGMGGGGMPPGMAEMMQQMLGGGMGGGMPGGMGGMPPGMGGMGGLPGGMPGGMPGQSRPRRQREQPHVMPASTRVLVRGLQGAAQHNGKPGRVEEFDDESRRYVVQLDDGDVLRIKHENLLQTLEGEVVGMQSKPEYNGTTASVHDFDAGSGRYHVSLRGKAVALQPANLILPDGARARVVGLMSQPQWNERVGKVVGFDREAKRYLVQMSEDQQLRIKLENLLL